VSSTVSRSHSSSDPRSDVPDRSCLPCPAPCRRPAWAAERPGRGATDAAAGHGPDPGWPATRRLV